MLCYNGFYANLDLLSIDHTKIYFDFESLTKEIDIWSYDLNILPNSRGIHEDNYLKNKSFGAPDDLLK